MGIPVNEKYMLGRTGARGHAYLDNVVGIVVVWKITEKEGREREGDMSICLNLLQWQQMMPHSITVCIQGFISKYLAFPVI